MNTTINSNEAVKLDGILFVAGYYGLLGAGFALSSLVIAVTALPHAWGMANANGFFFGGMAALVIAILVGLALGGWMLASAYGLWRGKASARPGTLLLSAVMLGMTILSVPVLLYSYGWRDATLDMLLTVAGIIAFASAASAWYLARPAVKASFE
jgi:uncharacterized membrane protein YidH (DUF202 family)